MNAITIAHEFDVLFRDGSKVFEGGVPVPKKSFDNLWQYILESSNNEVDQVMTVHAKGGHRYIKTGRYVGTIQTKDGHTIEILPKIYKASGKTLADVKLCRRVFLQMLRHFTDRKAKSFQNATLEAREGFPILEAYVNNYLNELDKLLVIGLRKNYATVEDNQKFLRGRLIVPKQVAMNACDKTKFYTSHNQYIHDIPQNRIIVSTLQVLNNISHSSSNRIRIQGLLAMMAGIPESQNIESDILKAKSNNRLFASYEMILQWSEQFLHGKGFTTFSGKCLNQSLLFSAERLFEDFVAHLFRKYAPTYNVDAQNTRYFLVDRHDGQRMFQLRPDILIETNKNSLKYECIIIDTKWKAIDSSKPDRHYLIDMKDMYQLYAYGQKYRQGQTKEIGLDVIPKLVLVYPYSEKFTEYLPEFVYEDIKEKIGLKLMVVPFDLTDSTTYERQIHNIIHCLDVKPEIQPIYRYEYDWEESTIPLVAAEPTPCYQQTMLVGCYRSSAHLDWIKQNHLYNIRLGNRNGAASKSGLVVSASRLLLYDSKNPKEYQVFNLDSSNHIIANNELMKSKGYPGLKPEREYLLYVITEESGVKPYFDVESLRQTYAPKLRKGSPFFVTI